MRVILYEPRPDISRAKRMRDVGQSLLRLGHEVEVIVNRYCSDVLTPDGQRIDCINTMAYFLYLPFIGHLHLADDDSSFSECRSTNHLDGLLSSMTADYAIVWNGLTAEYDNFLKLCLRNSIKVFYAELSWFDQSIGFYLDGKGVNGASSIADMEFDNVDQADEDLVKSFARRYAERDVIESRNGSIQKVLVVLQCEDDTNIKLFSPFTDMHAFLVFLEGWIPENKYSVSVRLHPKQQEIDISPCRPDFSIADSTESIKSQILESDLIIGINSTALVEALLLGRPVIRMGDGIMPGMIGKMSISDGFETWPEQQATDSARYAFLYHLIFEKQIEWSGLDRGMSEIFGAGQGAKTRRGKSIQLSLYVRGVSFGFYCMILKWFTASGLLARWQSIKKRRQ